MADAFIRLHDDDIQRLAEALRDAETESFGKGPEWRKREQDLENRIEHAPNGRCYSAAEVRSALTGFRIVNTFEVTTSVEDIIKFMNDRQDHA